VEQHVAPQLFIRFRNMHRLKLLLTELRSKFPDDSYLRDHDGIIKESLVLSRIHDSYERVLATLDVGAWEVLRNKAMQNFTHHESARGKQAFFDHLNEAFAYRFLLRSGCSCISFIEEPATQKKKGGQVRSPDLRFMQDGVVRYCEVKTINVSDNQLARDSSFDRAYDSSIFDLHRPFFAKLGATVCKALSQFEHFDGKGLVYLLIHSDDRALDDLETQKAQIANFMNTHFPGIDVFAKFGVPGRRYLRTPRQ
jgi:hypothetical protein